MIRKYGIVQVIPLLLVALALGIVAAAPTQAAPRVTWHLPAYLDTPQTWTAPQTFAPPNNQIAVVLKASPHQGNAVLEVQGPDSTARLAQIGADGGLITEEGVYSPKVVLRAGAVRATLYVDPATGALLAAFPNGTVRTIAVP